jgi:hypothetical protein
MIVWCANVVAMIALNSHFFVTFKLYLVPYEIPGFNQTLDCLYLSQYEYFFVEQWSWIDGSPRGRKHIKTPEDAMVLDRRVCPILYTVHSHIHGQHSHNLADYDCQLPSQSTNAGDRRQG